MNIPPCPLQAKAKLAAYLLDMSLSQFQRVTKRDNFPRSYLDGGSRYWDVSDLKKWKDMIKQQSVKEGGKNDQT